MEIGDALTFIWIGAVVKGSFYILFSGFFLISGARVSSMIRKNTDASDILLRKLRKFILIDSVCLLCLTASIFASTVPSFKEQGEGFFAVLSIYWFFSTLVSTVQVVGFTSKRDWYLCFPPKEKQSSDLSQMPEAVKSSQMMIQFERSSTKLSSLARFDSEDTSDLPSTVEEPD